MHVHFHSEQGQRGEGGGRGGGGGGGGRGGILTLQLHRLHNNTFPCIDSCVCGMDWKSFPC